MGLATIRSQPRHGGGWRAASSSTEPRPRSRAPRTLAAGTAQLSTGANQLADGTAQVAAGANQVADGAQQVAAGNAAARREGRPGGSARRSGGGSRPAGSPGDHRPADRGRAPPRRRSTHALAALDPLGAKITSGNEQVQALVGQVDQLSAGANQVAAGSAQVASGANQAAAGASQLASGAQQTASGASVAQRRARRRCTPER